MRLDGELFTPLGGLCRADEPDTPLLRARIVLTEAPPRLIVERLSAAWVWGALETMPQPHSVCFDIAERSTKIVSSPWRVRNTGFRAGDVWRAPGVAVTTPWRTACDLLRLGDSRESDGAEAVVRLLELAGMDVASAIARILAQDETKSVRVVRRLALLAG